MFLHLWIRLAASHRGRGFAVGGCLLVAAQLAGSGCGRAVTADPAIEAVTLATGAPGQESFSVGSGIIEALRQGAPDLQITHLRTDGSGASVDLVEQGRADIALAHTDTVYLEFQRQKAEHQSKLRGIAVLFPSVLHVVAANGSGIRSLGDLRGHRVAVGTVRGAHTDTIARLVLAAGGLTFRDIQPVWPTRTETARGLSEGTIDAAFRPGGFTDREAAGNVHLVPVAGGAAAALCESYPFLRKMVAPAGSYSGQHQPVDCIGMDLMLVARQDLRDDLVYRLFKILVHALPDIAENHPVLRALRFEDMSATPIPLHNGAVRFYREETLFR